jgi:release factor glutamine methyltransferase
MESLGRVLALSAELLRERGVPSAKLDASLIIGHALGLDRMQVYLQTDRPLSDEELATIRALLRRRAQREPLAHITGEREFMSLDFAVHPGLLVPRPDSELLVEALLERIPEGREEPVFVADIGCGTGCLGLALAKLRPCVRLYAVDRSRLALACTAANREALGLTERVALLEGDLMAPIPPSRPIDWVISNPPYIPSAELEGLEPEVVRFEDRGALDGGPDGLDIVRRLLPQAAQRARVGLVMEHAWQQGPATAALAREAGFAEALTLRDLAGKDRCLLATLQRP